MIHRLLLLCMVFLTMFATAALAEQCARPGTNGNGTPSGVVNTYFPGASSVNSGATVISLGSASGASTPIAAGDMLLVIQM